MLKRLWSAFTEWRERAFPCMTEYWTNGGPIMVSCDAYWAEQKRILDEIRERRRIARELATRPEFV